MLSVAGHDAHAERPWNVDFFQGPVVNSQRAVGLGGAFVGIADGVDGHLSNPASFAVRQPFFANSWFDWDFGTAAYTVFGDVDYDLSGRPGRLSSAFSEQGGFNVKFGRFGIGIHYIAQQFGIGVDVGAPDASVDGTKRSYAYAQSFGGLGMAYALRDGELVIGTIFSVGTARITALHTGDQIDLASKMVPNSFGVLFAPRGLPYRIGMAWRLGMAMTADNGDNVDAPPATIGGLRVPDSAVMGPKFDLGMSWMFGTRQYNIRPSYGDEPIPKGGRKVADIKRSYVLVSGGLTITGPVQDGVGVAAYLTGDRQVSGESAVVSLRGGAESEIMDNRLTVRGGSYLEPSRFARMPRLHMTAGADVRVNVYWDWRITLAIDVAADYQNTALGLGFWH